VAAAPLVDDAALTGQFGETSVYVSRLALQLFRSHTRFVWQADAPGPVWVQGPNGSGKTNLLEALSCVAPGRGLRGTPVKELGALQANGRFADWAVACTWQGPGGLCDLRLSSKGGARAVQMNGTSLRRQLDLTHHVAALWVTPLMDLLFREGASARRRFLNRLLVSLDPLYGALLLTYEKALQEWRALLEQGTAFDSWPQGLQRVIAQRGTLLVKRRAQWLEKVLETIQAENLCDRPVRLALEGAVEERYQQVPDQLEQAFLEKLEFARNTYHKAGRRPFGFGPHVSKINAWYDDKPIGCCSTGEQKMVLLALVLAAAYRRAANAPDLPFFLLLDELPAHLDAARLAHVLSKLVRSPLQAWVTSTDSPPAHATFCPQLLTF